MTITHETRAHGDKTLLVLTDGVRTRTVEFDQEGPTDQRIAEETEAAAAQFAAMPDDGDLQDRSMLQPRRKLTLPDDDKESE